MPNEYPMNDPRNIWQNQPTEPLKMSTDEMRRRAQRFQKDARSMTLFWITLGLVLCAVFTLSFFKAHGTLPRIGWALLSLWGLWGAYHAWRWIRPRDLPQDAPASTCLEFYRRELERRRDYTRHLWWKSGMPFCLLGVALAVVGTARNSPPQAVPATTMLLNAVPFFVLLAIWAVAVFFLRKKQKQRLTLQQEIDELRAYERGSR